MKVAFAQIKSTLENITANQKKISESLSLAKQKKVDLLVLPEMALSSYPPLDLLERKFFLNKIQKAVSNIHSHMPSHISLLLGTPFKVKNKLFNSALLLQKNKKIKIYSKALLADSNVFNESRYFKKGDMTDHFFYLQTRRIQLLICEEMWQWEKHPSFKNTPPTSLIICINASPFYLNKAQKRVKKASLYAKHFACPLMYVNLITTQKELLFDGGSFILNKKGKCIYQASFFKEEFFSVDLNDTKTHFTKLQKLKSSNNQKLLKPSHKQQLLLQALIFGLKEFVQKNGFQKVHLGLSGGVDSALTTFLAVKALGVKNVNALFLPGPFTSQTSFKAIPLIKKVLKINILTQEITTLYKQFIKNWDDNSQTKLSTLSKENIQARLRAMYLMAWSNEHPKSLLLSTSNKSELSMGYGTLYGDLSGGLFPLGDLFKTEVLKLASFLKTPAIPNLVLKRVPTAELKASQKDSHDLPPYHILDPILQKLVEQKKSPSGKQEKQIFKTIINCEFKRTQTAPILKVKAHSFDRGWVWPFLKEF